MKVKVNREKGIISFNNKEVKLQEIYYKKYTDIEKGANKTTIIVRLTPEQTLLFRETVLDTFVQLKIVTTSDNII